MYRLGLMLIAMFFLAACGSTAERPEPKCGFQMQTIQNLASSKYKLVGGLRNCEEGKQFTKEILLYAPGEPIDNHKVCNVFATTDTAITWQLQLAPNRIEVLFLQRLPNEGTIILQQETVYDSIEVVYGVLDEVPS